MSSVPPVCQSCTFLADDAASCSLLRDLTEDNAALLLTDGACDPRRSIKVSLQRDWSWLSGQQVEELAADGETQLLALARAKDPATVGATSGERPPNAYLFGKVQPPHGWAYRNLLRNELRRVMRQRKREVLSDDPRAAAPAAAEPSTLDGERSDHLDRLFAIDQRSGLLIAELLATGDVDRDLWRHVLDQEDAVLPRDLHHLVEAVRAELLGHPPPHGAAALHANLRLGRGRTDAAVTNALTLSRYKLCMLITGVLDEMLGTARDAARRLDVRALLARHFTPNIRTENQAYANLRALDEDRGTFASKQSWRLHYKRGAEESLARLTDTAGFGRAIADAEVGFRRVLGLPPAEKA